jgi:hypothetical protein
MTMSPGSINSATAMTVSPAKAAGTMTQAGRGGASLATRSSRLAAPTAPSRSSSLMAASFTS